MQTLTGKVAWVTGAGTGIGEAAALALARAGMTVVLTGRRAAMLETVAERINAAGPGKAQVRAADLTQSSAVAAVAEGLKRQLGRVDVVVNNAGANLPNRAWRNLTPEGIVAPAWSQGHGDWRYIRSVHARFGTRPLRTYPHFGATELAYYSVLKRLTTIFGR